MQNNSTIHQTEDPLLDSLTKRIGYLTNSQQTKVIEAYHYASKAHEGQYRRSGDPYISHPVAVANILSDMKMDAQSLMAALLHDVIEDCDVTKEQISDTFAPAVADLVDGVSKISAIKFESRKVQQAENFRKMVLAMTQDIRVILVKLADRLHNMRTLSVLNPEKRRRIATETLEIYAPIANRLGMNNIRVEFEDLGFGALYPMRSSLIKKAIKKARGPRREIMATLQASLEERLKGDNLKCRILSREKHLYSIYRKMRSQRKSFNQIMDVYGYRIIVDTVDTCYRVLGAVHNLYTPIPGRFKDYIAIPKANGYQSLHTTLKGLSGVPIEIQIRTEDMEEMANNGISAHWLYKTDDPPPDSTHIRTREWLKGLLELQKSAGNSLEFIENVKIDLFPDEVYVFTPKGNILELPSGATPVDFAYAVHTDVGNSCVASRIDARLAPLSASLQSGQTVEIITAPGTCPNPAWLSFVITGKARANIRHFLKQQQQTESIDLGRRLLNKALRSLNSSLEQVPDVIIARVLNESSFSSLDELLEDIGMGNRMAQLVAHRLVPQDPSSAVTGTEAISPPGQSPLAIMGTEGMVIKFAKCCRPIPGDAISGYLSSGKGIMVHRDNCPNIANELRDNPEKCLPVQWSKHIDGEYLSKLRIELENQRGALADIATTIADSEANIESITMGEKGAKLSIVNVVIGVKSRVHLARVIKRLRVLNTTIKISRTKS